MRNIKARTIRGIVLKDCLERGIPFSNRYYRKAKKIYTRSPIEIRKKV